MNKYQAAMFLSVSVMGSLITGSLYKLQKKKEITEPDQVEPDFVKKERRSNSANF